jgi:hypothetical protein
MRGCYYVTEVVSGDDQMMHTRAMAVSSSCVSKKGERGERGCVYYHLLQ